MVLIPLYYQAPNYRMRITFVIYFLMYYYFYFSNFVYWNSLLLYYIMHINVYITHVYIVQGTILRSQLSPFFIVWVEHCVILVTNSLSHHNALSSLFVICIFVPMNICRSYYVLFTLIPTYC